MEQYRTYLRAELGKLRDVGDCRDFGRKAGPWVADLGLPADAVALSHRFANQGFVDQFVGDLEDEALIDLTSCCSRWRDNGIANKLSRHQHPQLRLAATDRVRLNDAEDYLAGDFERLDWSSSPSPRT